MVNTDGLMSMRADEDTCMNMPTTSASRPYTYDEYPTAWTFETSPITEEEARGYMNVFTSLSRNDWVLEQRRRRGMYGTTLSEVSGLFGERHELALAASSGTMRHRHHWPISGTDVRKGIPFPRTRHHEAEPDEEAQRVGSGTWCRGMR
eukprot:5979682-Pyramimonas_sp.AAC.1